MKIKLLVFLFLMVFSSSAFSLQYIYYTDRLLAGSDCKAEKGTGSSCSTCVGGGSHLIDGVTVWNYFEKCTGDFRFAYVGGENPICPSGTIDDGSGNCEDPDCGSSGEDATITIKSSPPDYNDLCRSGCRITVDSFFQSSQDDMWYTLWIFTGSTCSASPDAPDLPVEEEIDEDALPSNNLTQPSDLDTDGDGLANGNDSDIDGDGINNSVDDDIDGDGVLNEDDATSEGQADEKEESTAHSSEFCSSPVSCSGDAISCAQLVELKRIRCELKKEEDEEEEDELGKSDVDNITNDFNSLVEDKLGGFESEYVDSINQKDDILFSNTIVDLVKSLFPSVSCNDIDFSYNGNPAFIRCSDTEIFRDVLAYIFALWACITIWNISKEPVNK